MYAAIEAKNTERCVHYMKNLQMDLYLEQTGLGLFVMQYHLGACFLTLLRNESQATLEELLHYLQHFGIVIDKRGTNAKKTFEYCLKVTAQPNFV